MVYHDYHHRHKNKNIPSASLLPFFMVMGYGNSALHVQNDITIIYYHYGIHEAGRL